MTSKDYLKQIAESKGICPFTNVVKDNALLFPVGFEKIFQDLNQLEELEKENKELRNEIINLKSNNSLLKKIYKSVENVANEFLIEKNKYKDVINILIDLLGIELDIDNCNLITDFGTIVFVNLGDKETIKELELLKEVLN